MAGRVAPKRKPEQAAPAASTSPLRPAAGLVRRTTLRRAAPLPRGTGVRRKSDRQRLIERLDLLARELVMRRDRGACVKCGSRERLQWCHVHSRARLSLRWRLENSMLLDAGCHLWWHHRPTEAVGWWTAKYPMRAALLAAMSGTRQKVDLRLEELWLKEKLGSAA